MPGEPAPIVTYPAPPLPAGDRPPAAEPPPRVWTVLLAYLLVVLASAIASGAVAFVAGLRELRERNLAFGDAAAEAVFRATMDSPGVLLGAAVATAVVLVIAALSAARLSCEPLRSRLALDGSRLGAAAFVVAAAGCAAVSSTFDAAFGALGLEQTGAIAQLNRALAGLSPGNLAVAVGVAGVAAPFAEELFFRGYVQTRLCLRWGKWTGVVVTAALFGLVHFDWIHSPSAFLIGLYLGWLTARSGGIAPAIAAHTVNNVLWAVATSAGLGANLARGAHAALLAVYVVGAVAAIAWLRPRLAAGAAVGPPPLPPRGVAAE
jgi:membrane protease YdiL (CAAX protease family)